jgi:hypothetical protein
MNQEQATTSAIAYAAVNNQDEMVAILSRNGVIVPTETLTLKMLIELIVNALAESRSFQNDFAAYADSMAERFSNSNGFDFTKSVPQKINVQPKQMNLNVTAPKAQVQRSVTTPTSTGSDVNWGKIAADALKIGFGWLQGRQQVTAANALAQAEADKLEAERLRTEGSSNTFAQQIALGRLSTTRVIVFGLIGVAVIGTAIYFFTRKKA